MGRIRTVKPKFFRHEDLQRLEESHSDLKPMLVFAGLFTIADREGRFEWRPKQIKLDILPFLAFRMEDALNALAGAGFITRYEVDGKEFGCIPSWHEHQKPNAREASSTIPDPPQSRTCKHVTARGEVEGKGNVEREGEGNDARELPNTDQIIAQIVRLHPKMAHLSELELPAYATQGVHSAAVSELFRANNDEIEALRIVYAGTKKHIQQARDSDSLQFVSGPRIFWHPNHDYRTDFQHGPRKQDSSEQRKKSGTRNNLSIALEAAGFDREMAGHDGAGDADGDPESGTVQVLARQTQRLLGKGD
jgi:hypothetical protein